MKKPQKEKWWVGEAVDVAAYAVGAILFYVLFPNSNPSFIAVSVVGLAAVGGGFGAYLLLSNVFKSKK